MKISVIKIGTPKYSEYSALVSVFQKRIKPFGEIESSVLKFTNWDSRFEKSLQKLIGPTSSGNFLVMLDERGATLKSEEFAQKINTMREEGQVKRLIFVIGGPYGFPKEFYEQCSLQIKLSSLVYTSDLAWLVLWEQLYRSFSIINKTPYHHS